MAFAEMTHSSHLSLIFRLCCLYMDYKNLLAPWYIKTNKTRASVCRCVGSFVSSLKTGLLETGLTYHGRP